MVHIIPHRQRGVSIPAEFYPALDMVDVLKKFFLCILGLNPTASASQWNDTLLITSIILPISSSDKVCTSLPFNTQLFAKLTAHPIIVFYETFAAATPTSCCSAVVPVFGYICAFKVARFVGWQQTLLCIFLHSLQTLFFLLHSRFTKATSLLFGLS